MSEDRQPRSSYEFGPFVMDEGRRRLLRGGETVPLTKKEFETLLVLVRGSGRVVEKDELMTAVWRNTHVEEGNLAVHVSKLRGKLGRREDGAPYIETETGLGYRFTARVHEVEDFDLVVRKRTFSHSVIEEKEVSDQPITVSASEASTLVVSKTRTRSAITIAAAAIIIVAVSVVAWRGMNYERTPLAVRSLGVMPFKVVNTEPGDEHAGLGMADVLITRLSNLREVNVRPTSAVMSFEGQDMDSINAGRKLNVDAILEGTIYRVNDRIRITARLVRVRDQSPIWAGEFEKPRQDELKVQDEIALQLVDALALNLSGGEKNALTKRYTESWDAYQLYLKGRHEWNKRSSAGMTEAERLFRNAIQRDPKFALAYVGLADTLAMREPAPEAMSAAAKALEIDPEMAEAHATMGFLSMFHSWEWQDAEESFKKSIDLNPGYATAHHWYATLLAIEGRNDQAKAELRRALEIDPLSYNFLADLGQTFYFNHEYDQAKLNCQKALDLYPDFLFAHQHLYDIYLQTGEFDNAFEENLALMKIESTFNNDPSEIKEGLEKYLASQRERYKRIGMKAYLDNQTGCTVPQVPARAINSNTYYNRAGVCAFLGEKKLALDNLEQAYQNKAFLLAYVKVNPIFDSLRSEPRYQAVLKNMGL